MVRRTVRRRCSLFIQKSLPITAISKSKAGCRLRDRPSNAVGNIAHMLPVLEVQLEIRHRLPGPRVVELSGAVLAAYPREVVGLVICGQGVALGETVDLDSLGLDLARFAVLVGFVHDDVAHDGLELVVRVAVAEILEGLLHP